MPLQNTPNIEKAAQLLRQGLVVGMPTETVYGLAGDAFNEEAVKKIFSLKKRPFFDPLIVHVASLDDVAKLAESIPTTATALMKAFWPGPLTLVLPKKSSVSDLVTSGLNTVGVRMPRHPMALELIQKAGSPLAAPSANLFGRTSPTCAEHVRGEFGDEVFVLDGGNCEVGLESTVVGFEGNTVTIYRPGAITSDMIRATLAKNQLTSQVIEKESDVAPGHLKHHYMPKIPVVIVPENTPLESLKKDICEKLQRNEWKPVRLQLSSDATLAARELYARLRECAESGASFIVIEKPLTPPSDLWVAIWNRLEKAATVQLGWP